MQDNISALKHSDGETFLDIIDPSHFSSRDIGDFQTSRYNHPNNYIERRCEPVLLLRQRVLPMRAAVPPSDPARREIEEEIRQMIIDDYRRNRSPQEALHRVRRFVEERKAEETDGDG